MDPATMLPCCGIAPVSIRFLETVFFFRLIKLYLGLRGDLKEFSVEFSLIFIPDNRTHRSGS
jgi:hypothetical protein